MQRKHRNKSEIKITKGKRTSVNEQMKKTERSMRSAHLVEVTVSHQLVLVLQSVLEQGPYDGLQFGVGGQQVGAQHLQPHVGQAVHYTERISFVDTSVIK